MDGIENYLTNSSHKLRNFQDIFQGLESFEALNKAPPPPSLIVLAHRVKCNTFRALNLLFPF